ncbi:MAG: hypothetical protein ACT4O3_08575 [Elusimicrobiota bacterium]
MTEEFRSLNDGPPTRLTRRGLNELQDALKRALDGGDVHLEFAVRDERRTVQAETVDDLAAKLPDLQTDHLSVRALRWTANQEIDAGVSLNFNHNNVSWQPHATDEGTFLKLEKHIGRFLENHKPWHWRLGKAMPAIGGIGIGLAAVGVPFAAAQGMYLLASTIAITGVVLWAASYMNLKQKLFPYVSVSLDEPQGPNRKEMFTLAIMVLTLLATIAGVIVNFLSGARGRCQPETVPNQPTTIVEFTEGGFSGIQALEPFNF